MGLDYKTMLIKIMSVNNIIPALSNAIKANQTYALHKASKQDLAFLQVLKENNFIQGYFWASKTKVKIFMGKSPFLSFKSISKPSFPIYLRNQDLWKFDKSLTILILTTSKGVITHKKALHLGVGGKVLAYII